jgi:hypothetical protein
MTLLFAALHESEIGTSRHFAAMQWLVGFRGIADMQRFSVRNDL